jgi:hypothetical protein
MSTSIFYKFCGQCMAQVVITARECVCGYVFEGSLNSRTQELDRRIEDERAYESYLEARLQQALDHLRTLREEDGRDTWTHEQNKKIQDALQALKRARDELNAQRRRTAESEEQLKQLHALRRRPTAGTRTRRRGGGRTTEVATHTLKTVERSPPAEVHDATMTATPSEKPAAAKVHLPAPKVPDPPPGASADDRTRTLPAIEGYVAIENLSTELEPSPTAGTAYAEPEITAIPTESFRQLQTSLVQHLFPAAVEPTRHCPHCTATVPADATRCGCGHELKSDSLMPAFTWPAGESPPAGPDGTRSRR